MLAKRSFLVSLFFATVLIAILVTWNLLRLIEHDVHDGLRHSLQSVLDVSRQSLHLWQINQKAKASSWADSDLIRRAVSG